jgi:hypothetical protein
MSNLRFVRKMPAGYSASESIVAPLTSESQVRDSDPMALEDGAAEAVRSLA